MTIFELQMLFHFHCKPEPWANKCEPYFLGIKKMTHHELIEEMLLSSDDYKRYGTEFVLTDRGRAYVGAIQNLPYPVAITTWEIPK